MKVAERQKNGLTEATAVDNLHCICMLMRKYCMSSLLFLFQPLKERLNKIEKDNQQDRSAKGIEECKMEGK